MVEKSGGKDIKPYPGWVEGQDTVTNQARRFNIFDGIRSLFHRTPVVEKPQFQGARPMTTQERVQSHKRAIWEAARTEKDPEIRTQLLRSNVHIRRREEKRKSMRQKAALAAAAVGAGVVMTTAPAVGQGIANAASGAGEIAGKIAGMVGARLNQPQPGEILAEQAARDNASSRKKEADFANASEMTPQTPPTVAPTPLLWNRTAVPVGQEPTQQPRIDPISTKKT